MLSRHTGTILVALGAFGMGCGGGSGASGGDAGGDVTLHDQAAPDVARRDGSHVDAKSPKGDGGNSGGQETGAKDTGTAADRGSVGPPDTGVSVGASVLQHHLNPNRDGHYIDPLMTKTYAANMKFDPTFIGTSSGPGVPIKGPFWAQPLYVENGVGGKGTFYTADDSNYVYAIDETTGMTDWSKPIAEAAGKAGSGCGNITPVGITGTPFIDLASRTMYFSAAIGIGSGIQSHQIYAISIDDGTTVAGWPVDVDSLTSGGVTFNPQPQEQRGALALLNGVLYVPYGGEDGDCGDYRGWVVMIQVSNPTKVTTYVTPAAQAGIWGVGGLASDGVDMFAATCNGQSGGLAWVNAQTEAVLRFHGGTFDSTNSANYFYPSNWTSQMDPGDLDLGGSAPLIVDVPGATPSALIVQLSKTSVVHLLDRANLGGKGTGNGVTGEGLYSAIVAPPGTASTGIKTAAATYTTPNGTFVSFHSIQGGTTCPGGTSGDLITIKISATSPPKFTTAWCASTNGNAGPIVTTTDASGDNAIVWVVGAEGSNELYGYDGETGATIFDGTASGMGANGGVIHFTTPIEVKGRIIVGASQTLYAFKGM